MITTPLKFSSFPYLCKDRMSQFCFYLSILRKAKSYTLAIALFALRGPYCFGF